MVRIASYNVENLFARPKAFNTIDWAIGQPALSAYKEVNELMQKVEYELADKERMRDLLVDLDIYYINEVGAIRRKQTLSPKWAWLRKNRGKFDRQPTDKTKNIEIVAEGQDDWIGWVELAKEPTTELSTRMTARVIQEVNADIIGIVEAEDRPSLVRFNNELLQGQYDHVMLVDGNDERGIDVGILTGHGFEIESIRSNVDLEDEIGTVFSRDCPQYEIQTPNGTIIHVLLNHFKSQSGGGSQKRQRQAASVRNIVNDLVDHGKHVIVLGDFNEGPTAGNSHAINLTALYDNNSSLVDCYSLQTFEIGNRLGSFDACGLSNRLDYIFISQSLVPSFIGGEVFRKGLWGSRMTRPTAWTTYQEITQSSEQASDHSLLFIDLNI